MIRVWHVILFLEWATEKSAISQELLHEKFIESGR